MFTNQIEHRYRIFIDSINTREMVALFSEAFETVHYSNIITNRSKCFQYFKRGSSQRKTIAKELLNVLTASVKVINLMLTIQCTSRWSQKNTLSENQLHAWIFIQGKEKPRLLKPVGFIIIILANTLRHTLIELGSK